MTEQVWWAAGARLPIVRCIANRAMAAPWNVLNEQQDSMSVRDAGWIQLYCRDNQEILGTTIQAYRIAEQVDAFLPARVPLTVVDPADPRNIGPVTLADPRADAQGVSCHGYTEIRALHNQALLDALEVIPAVDAKWSEQTGRLWGGLTWEHLLDDAEVVLVAAGSLGVQLTVAAEQLRERGVKAGVPGDLWGGVRPGRLRRVRGTSRGGDRAGRCRSRGWHHGSTGRLAELAPVTRIVSLESARTSCL